MAIVLSQTELDKASAVIRSLSLIINIGVIYEADHPLFKRTVGERMPALEELLKIRSECQFCFEHGQVVYEGTILEPGDANFSKTAEMFLNKGIAGVAFIRGVTEDEIGQLVELVGRRLVKGSRDKLRVLLQKAGVRHIKELAHIVAGGGGGGAGVEGENAGRAPHTRAYAADIAHGQAEDESANDDGGGDDEYARFMQAMLSRLKNGSPTPDIPRARPAQSQGDDETAAAPSETEEQPDKLQADPLVRRLEELDGAVCAGMLLDASNKVLRLNAMAKQLLGPSGQLPSTGTLRTFLMIGHGSGRVIVGNRQFIARRIDDGAGADKRSLVILD